MQTVRVVSRWRVLFCFSTTKWTYLRAEQRQVGKNREQNSNLLTPLLPTSIDYSIKHRLATSENAKLKKTVEQDEPPGYGSQLQSNGFSQPTPLKWSKQEELKRRSDIQPMQSCRNEQWKFEKLENFRKIILQSKTTIEFQKCNSTPRTMDIHSSTSNMLHQDKHAM
ncbi:7-cyano-7-deazaguanine synthase [Trichinella spiralis]|uniref:7-cyano-7-deazaguanine synthase n=1 Tax=Trichinella spiralis TaxID=6334 RepID=A0ABR3KEK4_TRISP